MLERDAYVKKKCLLNTKEAKDSQFLRVISASAVVSNVLQKRPVGALAHGWEKFNESEVFANALEYKQS